MEKKIYIYLFILNFFLYKLFLFLKNCGFQRKKTTALWKSPVFNSFAGNLFDHIKDSFLEATSLWKSPVFKFYGESILFILKIFPFKLLLFLKQSGLQKKQATSLWKSPAFNSFTGSLFGHIEDSVLEVTSLGKSPVFKERRLFRFEKSSLQRKRFKINYRNYFEKIIFLGK